MQKRGRDHIDFLAAQVTVFARVGVEPGDQNARLWQAKQRFQIAIDNAQRLDNAVHGQRRRHVLQREMGGSERDAQRPVTHAREHHDDARRMRAFSEIFGMAGEGNAGVVDGAFLQRRGDDSVETAAHRTVYGCIEQIEHVAPVSGIQLARGDRHAQRVMLDLDGRARGKPRRRPCPFGHQLTVAQH